MRALPSRLLVVTDRHQAKVPLPVLVADLLAAGMRWLWLRDRDLPREERRTLAEALAAQVRAHPGAVLTVGADIDLAAEIGAVGVQLRSAAGVAPARQALGRQALIGVSAHSLGEVRAAAEAGADYATLSPIYPSPSKPGYGPSLGSGNLVEAARWGLPVLALGGVTAATAAECLAAGAAGVAMMGSLMRHGAAVLDDPELAMLLPPAEPAGRTDGTARCEGPTI